MPSYQSKHVGDYFSWVRNNTQFTPVPGYAVGTRGFPDITLQGFFYLTKTGVDLWLSSGTSATAPAVAGFLSNLNAARMKLGKGSLGWVHPALYANYKKFTNDITSGDIKCTQTAICCSSGFYASPGWDPASGLGSLNYGNMEALFKSLGKETNGALYYPSYSPTVSPTRSPTRIPTSATAMPTQVPSLKPTTTVQSVSPTVAPTVSPSSSPSLSPNPKN